MTLIRDNSRVYAILEQELREEIYANRIHDGQKINSEMHLAKKYNIGRSSVRIALDHLKEEGLLQKIKGSGTFVVPESERPLYRNHAISKQLNQRQVLFLSFSTAFSEETFNIKETHVSIFNGLTRVLQQRGYNLLFSHVGVDLVPTPSLLNDDIAGVIFYGEIPLEFWDKYMKHLPCVGLHYINPDIECSWVCLDDESRSYQAVSHLKSLGHKKIGFLTDECKELIPARRIKGYRKAMSQVGLEISDEWQICWQRRRVAGELVPEYIIPDYREHLKPLFLSENAPTALICFDNWRAFATMSALDKMGLRVPEDVSIIGGFEDKPIYVDCTAFCDRMEDICAEAGQILLNTLDTRITVPCKTVLLRPKLIISGNTTALNSKK